MTTAGGEEVQMVALGGPTRGLDFAVVWVCTSDDWDSTVGRGGTTVGIPWPVEYVRELAGT